MILFLYIYTKSSLELASSAAMSLSLSNQPALQNRTYSDMNRMHAELPPSHLEHLARSMALNASTADSTALENAHTNYLVKVNSTKESSNAAAGSTNNDSNNEPGGIGHSRQETAATACLLCCYHKKWLWTLPSDRRQRPSPSTVIAVEFLK